MASIFTRVAPCPLTYIPHVPFRPSFCAFYANLISPSYFWQMRAKYSQIISHMGLFLLCDSVHEILVRAQISCFVLHLQLTFHFFYMSVAWRTVASIQIGSNAQPGSMWRGGWSNEEATKNGVSCASWGCVRYFLALHIIQQQHQVVFLMNCVPRMMMTISSSHIFYKSCCPIAKHQKK